MAAESDQPTRFVLSFDTLKAWAQRQKYEFSENPQLGQLAIHYALLGQPSPLLVLPEPARGMVMFVMKQPFTVPPERRAAVVEAAAMLNSTSFMGAWVLNPNTGDLVFRVTVAALDIGYTDAGVLHVARVVVGTSERAAPALKAVALDGVAPAQALSGLASA
jgi:hypothetical protein